MLEICQLEDVLEFDILEFNFSIGGFIISLTTLKIDSGEFSCQAVPM